MIYLCEAVAQGVWSFRSTLCTRTKINGMFVKVVSSVKERNEDIDRSSIFLSIDLNTKSKDKFFSRTTQTIAEGLELDVPSGSKCYVNSSSNMDKFTFLKRDDKRGYIGASKKD